MLGFAIEELNKGTALKLDFLIAASPNIGFFSQIAFFRLCLNKLGGHYAKARLVAVFGDHEVEHVPAHWREHFDGIEVEWAHPVGAVNPNHRAQHDRRFELIREDADLAILCDADVAILKPFDDLLERLVEKPALAAVIAHYHSFQWDGGRKRDPDVEWPELAQAVIGKDVLRPHRYTLMAKDAPPAAPFYINYGMLAGTPALLRAFYKRDLELRPRIAEFVGHWWAPQVSVALTCADLCLPTQVLPMRYNFPNDPVADSLYPEELEKIVFLHYLREKVFKRDQIFASKSNFNAFVENKLVNSNEIFRKHVVDITKGIFPFSS